MPIGSKLYRTHHVTDPIAWAQEHIATAPDGAVFLADKTDTTRDHRGLIQPVWQGQLLVTFLLKPAMLAIISPDDVPIRLNQLVMALSLGLLEPCKSFGAKIAWPHALSINNTMLGNLIINVAYENDKPQGIIVSVWINVNTLFDQGTAEPSSNQISLRMQTGTEHALRPLYKNLIDRINFWYEQWQDLSFINIYKTWRKELAQLGKLATFFDVKSGPIFGTLTQVMPNGDALITTSNGKLVTLPLRNHY